MDLHGGRSEARGRAARMNAPCRPSPGRRALASSRTAPVARVVLILACLTLIPGAARIARAQTVAGGEAWEIQGENLRGSAGGGAELELPVITHGDLTVSGQQGRLSADREVATIQGSVRIADPERVILAEHGVYRRTARLLDLVGNVRGTGPEGEFRSDELNWDRLAGRLILRGEPRLIEPERLLWAQRVEYNTVDQTGVALGEVRILLLPDSTWAYGDRTRYDRRASTSVLTGEPYLISPGRPGEPDLRVDADTLRLQEADETGIALGNVRIERGPLRARSQRAWFRLREDRILLAGDPVTWDASGEIRADSMEVRLSGGEAEQLRAWGNVRVRYEPSSEPGERNLVFGDTLIAGFREGAVTSLDVQGDAVSLYLPSVRDAREGTGRNLSRGRLIRVHIARGEARRVDLIGAASGSYRYPSASQQRRLSEPAFLDSVLPLWTQSGFGRPGSDEPPAEPPPLPPALASMIERRELLPADSLLSPYDQLFDERVDYEGDSIRFHVPEDRIRVLGSGVVKYRQSELQSREIVFDAKTNLITALGAPELSDQESTVTGRKMTYRTDEREGIVYRGRTEFDGGYYHGREVKKLETEALLVRQGDYTTCEADTAPHYHFHADRMKLMLKDKAVARPVILYLKNIPVLALPYYIFPLKHGRASGVMMPDVELGFNRSAGRFVRNLGYYWAMNDYMDARAWVDYYDQGPRLYWNGIYRYKVRYSLDGDVQGSYLRTENEAGGRSVRWSVRGSHGQKLPGGADLRAQADFTTDQSFRGEQDFSTGVHDRLNRQLKSSVALSRSWSRVRGNLSASRTEYLDETSGAGTRLQVDGPSADFNVNTGAIGRARDASGRGGRLPALASVYYGTSFRFRSIYTKRFDGTKVERQAMQQSLTLSDNRSLGPYLRLNPSLSGGWAVFDRDNLENRRRGGFAWNAGVGASSTLFGTFAPGLGPLDGLRHVIEPTASWSYAPELRNLTYVDSAGVRRARFPNVGGIGLSGSRRSAVSLGLNQRFHLKWRSGEQVSKKENVLTWSTGTGYDFLQERREGQARARHWSTISNRIAFRPFSLFDASASTEHDPYTRERLSFQVSTTMRLHNRLFRRGAGAAADTTRGTEELEYGEFGEADLEGSRPGERRGVGGAPGLAAGAADGEEFPWDLGLSHSYRAASGGARASNTLNTSLSLNPTRNWRISGSVYADLRTREVISHSFGLYRDLHCWEFRFDHRTSGGNAEYSFRIAIKQIPDVKYERESR